MDKLAFTRANLSGVRVIMTMMHVPMEELLCQAMMGWVQYSSVTPAFYNNKILSN
jgi:hypothetical protein